MQFSSSLESRESSYSTKLSLSANFFNHGKCCSDVCQNWDLHVHAHSEVVGIAGTQRQAATVTARAKYCSTNEII